MSKELSVPAVEPLIFRHYQYLQIVQAIANLESTGVTIARGFWSLNRYRW